MTWLCLVPRLSSHGQCFALTSKLVAGFVAAGHDVRLAGPDRDRRPGGPEDPGRAGRGHQHQAEAAAEQQVGHDQSSGEQMLRNKSK